MHSGDDRLDIWVLSLMDQRFPLIQRISTSGVGSRRTDAGWHTSPDSVAASAGAALPRLQDRRTRAVSVSSAGGTAPRGSVGRLCFISADGTVMVADVNAGAGIPVGVPRALFQVPRSHGDWAVVSDGSRFLIAMPAGPDTSAPFTILWNRLAGLRPPPRS